MHKTVDVQLVARSAPSVLPTLDVSSPTTHARMVAREIIAKKEANEKIVNGRISLACHSPHASTRFTH